jgi:hypothetical protein
MDERFERLKKIAKEEFGAEIVRCEKTSNFNEIYGFDVEEVEENNIGV